MRRNSIQTKKLIDETALHLFVEKGVIGTTIKDIATAAGIAEGTLYCHYASKNDLAWELFSKNYIELAVNLDRCQKDYPSLKGKLEAMIRLFCNFFDENPILFNYLLLDHHGHIRRMTPEMPSTARVLKGAITQAMVKGEIPQADCDVKTAMVLGLILQVAVFQIYGRLTQSLSSLAPTLMEDAWKVLSI